MSSLARKSAVSFGIVTAIGVGLGSLALGVWASSEPALAAKGLSPGKVYVADAKKTEHYVKEGLITGGDRSVDDVVVLDVRHAARKGYDRIVLDLEGNRQGDPAPIKRPPYYQVSMTPEMHRMVFTVWGRPKLAFDSRKVHSGLKRSRLIRSVELYPVMEKDRWTFALDLKKGKGVEVFELADPVRVIIDIKQ